MYYNFQPAFPSNKKAQKTGLSYYPVNKQPLHFQIYTEASLASNMDLFSQLSYLVLLCDEQSCCIVICSSSKKSKRIVSSIMGAKLYAFCDAFGAALSLATDISVMLLKKVPF